MRNEEEIDNRKVVKKIYFNRYGAVFVFVGRFGTSRVVDG